MKTRLKEWIEKLSGCRIYRDSLPHGTDLFRDIGKVQSVSQFKTVLDVGSHQGQSIQTYLEEFPQASVHGFEPSDSSFQKLKSVYRSDKRVHLHQLAVSDSEGDALLYLKSADTTHSLVRCGDFVDSQPVRTITLDSFCQANDLTQIDFCKIDTEGHDLNVLKGAVDLLRDRRISFVQVETSTRLDTSYFCRLQEMEPFLGEFSYELFGFYEQQPCWSGRKSLLYFNAVFISSDLVGTMPPIAT